MSLMYSSIFASSPLEYASSSFAEEINTVPLVSVDDVSTAHPNTATLTFFSARTDPSTPRRITIPCTTVQSDNEDPGILDVRTLSTLKFMGFFGKTSMHACATTVDNLSSNPCCLELKVPLILPAVAATSLTSSTSLPSTTSSSIHSNVFVNAFSYPSMISLGCNPSRTNSSANPKSSPANVTTRFVPSPISRSCDCAAITINLAAGCATSNSRTITAASLVTNNRSR
mmetsp:Transcript_5808/g.21022  ORF Transcript_5808/g.21022 Transcript_5808/m.21022 type:complete len:228 (+) Transcript_5808:901-1584(+)